MDWSLQQIQRFATANNLDVPKRGKGITKAKLLQSIRNLPSKKTREKNQTTKKVNEKETRKKNNKEKDKITNKNKPCQKQQPLPKTTKKPKSGKIDNFQRKTLYTMFFLSEFLF